MRSNKLKAHYRFIAASLLAFTIVHGIVFWQERGQIVAGYGDFSHLYTAGLLVRRGEGRYLYDRHEQWRLQKEVAPNVDILAGPRPFLRPSFEALVFLPLAYFSYPVAFLIWSLAKVVFLWLAVRVLPRANVFTRVYPAWLEVALSLGFFPVFYDLLEGQDDTLLLLITAVTLNRLKSGKDRAAGAILALGLFKFQLVLPIVIMIWLAGRPRIWGGFLSVAAALVALSLVVSGASALFAYPAYLMNLNGAGGLGIVKAQNMTNLRGLLAAFFTPASFPGAIYGMLLVAAIAAIVFTARQWRRVINTSFSGLALGYCLALVVAMLTSFYAYSYDMTLLIIPLLLLGGGFADLSSTGQQALPVIPRRIIASGLLLLICSPLYWALTVRFNCSYLLVIPMFILALGIGSVMRHCLR